MNNLLTILVSVGIGIGIGIVLEKQYHLSANLSPDASREEKKETDKKPRTKKTLYSKSGTYQDQSKEGKGKGLTKESKTGNIE